MSSNVIHVIKPSRVELSICGIDTVRGGGGTVCGCVWLISNVMVLISVRHMIPPISLLESMRLAVAVLPY